MSIYLEFPSLTEYPVYLPQSSMVVNVNDTNEIVLRSEEIAGDFVEGLVDRQFINALGFFQHAAK